MFPYNEIMRHFECPEHPQVARTLATGYPNPAEREECAVCGSPASAWHIKHGYRCTDCARKIFEQMNDEDAVEMLGFEVIE